MSRDTLRTEANERVDLGDYQFQSGEGQARFAEQTPGQMLTDPSGKRAWILDGFAIDNPSGNQIRVTKGRAILSRREGGIVTHGMVTTEGDATKIIDTTAFTAVVHGIFIRFEFVDGDLLGRVFWNASTLSELIQNIYTRRKANWSMRIEQTNPGAEWFKIGEVDLSVGPGSITDQRDFYFEGVVSASFANTWGGGTDRNSARAVNGIKDLQEFTAAVRTLFEQLRPSGARWWDDRGLDVIGVLSGEAGVTGRGAAVGNSIGVNGIGFGLGAGVQGTGSGTGGTGVEGIGTGTDPGVNGTGGLSAAGVQGNGGTSNGIGVLGAGGFTNGVGVRGNGEGTGTGVVGVGGATGYGVQAQADTSSPERSALRIVPQDAEPTTALQGDTYFHGTSGPEDSGRLHSFDGTIWTALVHQNFALTADVVEADSTGFQVVQAFTIPANSLRPGSTIRVLIHAEHSGDAAAATATFRLRFGGDDILFSATQTLDATGIPAAVRMEATIQIQTVGVLAQYRAWGLSHHGGLIIGGLTAIADINMGQTSSNLADTTGPLDVDFSANMSVANAGNSITLKGMWIDIAA